MELRIAPDYFGCMSHITFSPFSTGDVEVIGITFLRSRVYRNGIFATYHEMNFVTPYPSFISSTTIGEIHQSTNVTAEGIISVQYLVDSVIEEETFSFKSTIIAPLDITGSTYSQLLPLVWVEFLLLLAIIALIVQAFYLGKRIKSRRFYTKEMKEKDREFFKYLEKVKKS